MRTECTICGRTICTIGHAKRRYCSMACSDVARQARDLKRADKKAQDRVDILEKLQTPNDELPPETPADRDRERQCLARFAARQAAEDARDAPYAPKAYRAPSLADAEAIQGILAPPRGDVLTGNARQASYGAGQPRTGSWE